MVESGEQLNLPGDFACDSPVAGVQGDALDGVVAAVKSVLHLWSDCITMVEWMQCIALQWLSGCIVLYYNG